MSFHIKPLQIPAVVHIEPDVYGDSRGFFTELFKSSDFSAAGIDLTFKQFNHSRSARHVLRGLHYQLPPEAQAKLVMIVAGEIFDVAVDIRKNSPTFGQWTGLKMSAARHDMVFVPAGFAHGFCVLSAHADILYYCDNEYSPRAERGIIWNDPELGIDWPIKAPELSVKDSAYPKLQDAELASA